MSSIKCYDPNESGSLIPPMYGPNSRIREMLATEIRNPVKLCLGNLESWALEYGIQL